MNKAILYLTITLILLSSASAFTYTKNPTMDSFQVMMYEDTQLSLTITPVENVNTTCTVQGTLDPTTETYTWTGTNPVMLYQTTHRIVGDTNTITCTMQNETDTQEATWTIYIAGRGEYVDSDATILIVTLLIIGGLAVYKGYKVTGSAIIAGTGATLLYVMPWQDMIGTTIIIIGVTGILASSLQYLTKNMG